MNKYKNMDLKVDLLLLNQDTADDFINKYKDNIKLLIQCIKILIYLDDFMYIDEILKNKLILVKEILIKNQIEFDQKTFESDIVELDKRMKYKTPRGKTAIMDYYNDLNKFITNNDFEIDRLNHIKDTIKMMDYYYMQIKNNEDSSNRVILFLTDIKYKIELYNIETNLYKLMNSKKVKKMTKSF